MGRGREEARRGCGDAEKTKAMNSEMGELGEAIFSLFASFLFPTSRPWKKRRKNQGLEQRA